MTFDPARMVAFDCETHLIQPGLLAPPLVCGSVAAIEAGVVQGALLDKVQSLDVFRGLIESDRIIVGANIPFDLLVCAVEWARRGVDLMPAIFDKFERGEVYDVLIAEALHGIANGHLGEMPDRSPLKRDDGKRTTRYSLFNVCGITLGRWNAKANDAWRERYAELEHVSIAEWPPEARIYPVDDAVNTLEAALVQIGAAPRPNGDVWVNDNLHDLANQVYSAWALHLGAAWGFRVDAAAVDALEARVVATRAEKLGGFIEAGFFKLDVGGRPLVSDKTGAEKKDEALITRLTALAYGCSGVCVTCAGSGKVPGVTGCRACNADGSDCTACAGAGKVPALKKDGTPRSWKGCPACDATGLDLSTGDVPRTDGGGVSTGRDALAESGDELLMNFAVFSEEDKLRTTYLPFLRKGTEAPLNLRPNVLLATGRVSYEDAIQQLPRKGGVRECMSARPGYVYCSCDYSGVELGTHAQSCLWLLGSSSLADALNGGVKPHDSLGARLAGVTYEAMLARDKKGFLNDCRQAAKAANFGFPGGMGAPKFVLTKRKDDFDTVGPDGTVYKGLRLCVLIGGAERCGVVKVTSWGPPGKERPTSPTCRKCIECAEDLRKAWFEQWPENRLYFKLVADIVERHGYIEQHVSQRRRGGVEFTAAANGFFQSLAADGAKLALRRVAREQYVDRQSPLYGSRTILFAHDELIVEMPEDRAHEAATRLSEVMVGAMREFVPDVLVEAEPALMRRWYKGAESVRENGRLVPWEPKQ